MNNLPKGTYYIPDDYIGDYGDWMGYTYETPSPKCECGSHITFGEQCNPEFHSSFCPLYKEKKND